MVPMKKFIKISLIVIAVILALLIILPYAFRGRIIEMAKTEINKNLNARVDFDDLRLSLIRNFPNLSVTFTRLSVVGVDRFEYDTLAYLPVFRTVVDLKSLLSDEVLIRSIRMDHPRFKTLVLADGTANWDIMLDTGEPEVREEEPFEFRVQLKSFDIRNGWFEYDDIPLEFRTTLGSLNLNMKGDLTQDLTSLDITASSEFFNLWYENIRYIYNARLDVETLLDADLNRFMFTFREGDVRLNEIEMDVDGYFAMPDEDIEIDINFIARRNDFKAFLSLVPAIYMTDFDALETSGYLGLEGYIRGVVSEETIPSVGIDVVLENGRFSYPDLPESVENVNMNLSLYYDGVDEDKTTVDLRNFHMEMAGNPFDMKLSIRTPVSDMAIDVSAVGTIDFTTLADVIPLEDVTIRGLLESDFYFTGNMSEIENERYESLNTGGTLRLTAFQYSGPDFHMGVSIPSAAIEFSPRFVELRNFESVIGRSDLRMNGRLENFMPYVFSDGTLKGNLSFSSRLLDLNELLGEEPADPEADTLALTLVEIPGNIDFILTSSVEAILFDNLEINQMRGRVVIRDNRLVMDGVRMQMLGGSLGINGEYNTSDMSAPFIDFSLDIENFDIPSSFHAFNTVEQLVPVAERMNGRYSTRLQMYSILDDEMSPVISTMEARGRLRTSGIQLTSSETFDRLASVLRLRSGQDLLALRDVDLSFEITGGRVHVEPFNIRMGPADAVIGGSQGIDLTLDYLLRMTVPRAIMGQGADQLIDNLASRAAERGLNIQPGPNVNLDARISGTFSDPRITLDMRETTRATIDQVRDQLRERATEEIERRVEEVEDRIREDVSERARQIIREAETRADQIREAAESAAETMISEGDANAARIEQQAAGRGRIAEAAAKRTADGVRREARENADRLRREADERSRKIIEEARSEAERLE
jgi:cell division septum initiation protein DivIVA